METLNQAKVGTTVIIRKFHGEGNIKRRIMDMGLTKGTEIQIEKIAPLGDPIALRVRNYQLSIRKSDAKNIEIETGS